MLNFDLPVIGRGVDGIVYAFEDKAIKYSAFSERKLQMINSILFMSPHEYVRVHKCGALDNHCYVLMDKLLPISEDEYKVFHTILSHEDNNLKKDLSPERIMPLLKGLSFGLDFDYMKVAEFIKTISKSNFVHLDLHPRNIMKNNMSDFKLIDLDRISYERS